MRGGELGALGLQNPSPQSIPDHISPISHLYRTTVYGMAMWLISQMYIIDFRMLSLTPIAARDVPTTSMVPLTMDNILMRDIIMIVLRHIPGLGHR